MRHRHLSVAGPFGFHKVAYTEWGDPANPRVLVCVHGLTRNGRDFDVLAQSLAEGWRVVCPDMPGRGDSDWLPVKATYALPTYVNVCVALIARLDVEAVDWLGTSMGGLIGMSMAALPGAPLRRLIVNDIGAFIPKSGLERIAGFTGTDPRFDTVEEVEIFLRQAIAPFGITEDAHWRHIALTSSRPDGHGKLRLHYDPGIAEPFFGTKLDDVDLWPVWDRIPFPTLLLRGAQSDLLPMAVAQEMTQRGPKAELIELAGCGHAPALMDPAQIAAVRSWLERD
jgi:pimeloyl-ACP methyl ester carboxylesterase